MAAMDDKRLELAKSLQAAEAATQARLQVTARLEKEERARQNAMNIIDAFRGHATNEDIDTMLDEAIASGEIDFLHQDAQGMCMVHYAAQRGDKRLVKVLLKAAPNSANIVTHVDRNPKSYDTSWNTTIW